MRRAQRTRLVCALALIGAAGCGQYLGYRIESTKEISREDRIVKKGKPQELRMEIQAPAKTRAR